MPRDLDKSCCTTVDKETAAAQPTFLESLIYVGKKLIYKNEGHNAVVTVEAHKLDNNGMLAYDVRLPSGEVISALREYLSRPENPDITSIPTTTPQVKEAIASLNREQVKSLLKH